MNASFPKAEKLTGKKRIDQLFAQGKSIKKFPIRLVYFPLTASEPTPNKAGFSVPKRNFKKAVDRNLLKRRLREAYRLNKHILADIPQGYSMMFLYMGKHQQDFFTLNAAMAKLLAQLENTVKT